VNTYGTARVKDENGNIMSDGDIAKMLDSIFDLTPHAIVKRFGLKNPIFKKTASYGHFGREPFEEDIEVFYEPENPKNYSNGQLAKYTKKVSFFAWEKLDYVDKIKAAFGI
jgi:S-adenosylmethionine synthetase